MSHDCVFCRIVKGELPAAKVYEDAEVLAFMDIGPVIKGHTLVIPKLHCNPITNAPVETLAKVIAVVQRIARAQFKALEAGGVSVSQANGAPAGQVVPHVHFHVIPRYEADGTRLHWVPGKYDSPSEIERYAARLRDALD